MIYTVTLNPALDREYVVPDLAISTVLRASAVNIDFGGKGFNVSRMLASLGKPSTALGFVGGNTGQVLADGLSKSGIEMEFLEICGETRTNTSIVETNGEEYFKVNEPGPVISGDEITKLLEKINQLAKEGDWWVLAGSLPPGVPLDIYRQIIGIINSRKGKAVLDTSGEPLKLGCGAGPYMIKPNVEEAAQITGLETDSPLNLNEMIAKIHAMGVNNIVLSAGEGNSRLSDGEHQWIGAPPHVIEKNPTGAGDAMLAAMVYQLEEKEPLVNAFKWGIACGSAAASQTGTGMPSLLMVEKLLKEVIITKE
jgi:1-phosphofructokinase family hexose kinase